MLVLINKLTKKIITIIVVTALIVTVVISLKSHKQSSSCTVIEENSQERLNPQTPNSGTLSSEEPLGNGSPNDKISQERLNPQTPNSGTLSSEEPHGIGSPNDEISQGLLDPQTPSSGALSRKESDYSDNSIKDNAQSTTVLAYIPEVSEPPIASGKTSAKDSLDLNSDNLSQEYITNNVPPKAEVEMGDFVLQTCENSHLETISESLKNDSANSSIQEEVPGSSSEFKTVESSSGNGLPPKVIPISSTVSEESFEENTQETSYSISTEVSTVEENLS